jgi:hypothetical protein
MPPSVAPVRSLTNPFGPDPTPRPSNPATTTTTTTDSIACNNSVKKKKKKSIGLRRSLSNPMLDAPRARSDASMKRAVAAKLEMSKAKKQYRKQQEQHPKQQQSPTSYNSVAMQELRNLEYFDFYTNTPPTPVKDKNGVLLWEVDRVLGKIVCGCGSVQYLVKWTGCPHSANSCINVLPEEFRSEWV